MSANENARSLKRRARKPLDEDGVGSIPSVDIASYIAELLRGVRHFTKPTGRKDLASLDRLLAMTEDEASRLSSSSYH